MLKSQNLAFKKDMSTCVTPEQTWFKHTDKMPISCYSASVFVCLCLCCPQRLRGRTAPTLDNKWDREQARSEGGKWEVGEVGLVVYQVSNTEANELPGLSGLASRQCTVARIHYDCSHYTNSPPLGFLFSLSSSTLL